jgi:hypothetical protein
LDASVYSLVPTILALSEHSEDNPAAGTTLDDFDEADVGAEKVALSDILQDGSITSDDEDDELEDVDSTGEPEVVLCWEPPDVLYLVSYKHPYSSNGLGSSYRHFEHPSQGGQHHRFRYCYAPGATCTRWLSPAGVRAKGYLLSIPADRSPQ